MTNNCCRCWMWLARILPTCTCYSTLSCKLVNHKILEISLWYLFFCWWCFWQTKGYISMYYSKRYTLTRSA